MLDILKKIFGSSENSENKDVEEKIEELKTTGELKDEDFYAYLFSQIVEACNLEKSIPFKVCNIKEEGFLIKVKGLFSLLPFHLMPWQYPDTAYWKIIAPALLGKEFKCKVIEASQQEGQPFFIRVDATVHPFRQASLVEHAEYSAIILQRSEKEALVDLGVHFRWKFGSLTARLPVQDTADPETAQRYEPGQTIKVQYLSTNEEGLRVEEAGLIDLYEKYSGRIVWVQVSKIADTAPCFLVEGKYKADMPVTKTVYPENKRKVQKLKNQLVDGDIINCEVLDFKSHRGLIVKCVEDSCKPDVNWTSYTMMDYIGREVLVFVHQEEDDLVFMVEDRYPAKVLARSRSKKKEQLSDGEIIRCWVSSIDVEEQCFRIRLINN
jgi:hypothetical protein